MECKFSNPEQRRRSSFDRPSPNAIVQNHHDLWISEPTRKCSELTKINDYIPRFRDTHLKRAVEYFVRVSLTENVIVPKA